MAGLVPAIHVFVAPLTKDVDTRHKAGHDESIIDIADCRAHYFPAGTISCAGARMRRVIALAATIVRCCA